MKTLLLAMAFTLVGATALAQQPKYTTRGPDAFDQAPPCQRCARVPTPRYSTDERIPRSLRAPYDTGSYEENNPGGGGDGGSGE